MYSVPALSHRLFSPLSHTHFPTCLRGLLSCLATHMLIFQVSLCFLLGAPVYRDLFYSCQRLSRHWCKVFITHAAPEIPALSISFNFSCYLRFFSLFSHSILCPYCHLSLTIDCSGLVIGTFNILNTYFSKSAQYLSELCLFLGLHNDLVSPLFCSTDPCEMVSTRMQEMWPIPYSVKQTLQEGRWSDLFLISVLVKALPLRLPMSCQLVLHFRAQYQ